MRPETIVMGELRGHEVNTFLDLCASGHGSSLATIHSSNPKMALKRMIMLSSEKVADLIKGMSMTVVHLERRILQESNQVTFSAEAQAFCI